MKHFKAILIVLFIGVNAVAQTPGAFKYQALVRNSSGEILSNQNVSFRISILEGAEDGISVYQEEHNITTNENGLVFFNIGQGLNPSTDFESIDWGSASHFVQVELDITGGANYVLMGVSQLLSVPYALYAKSVENNEDYWQSNDADDIFYSAGNIGIGNVTPETKLDIKGNGELEPNPMLIKNEGTNELRLFSISDISYANSSVIFNRSRGTIDSEDDLITEDRVGGIYWRPYISNDYQRTAAIQAFVGTGVSSTSFPTNIRFETTLIGSTDREEIMRISENGNVGIGIKNPNYTLDVNGTINATQLLINGNELPSPSLWNNTADNIFYSSGNVGIGNSNPETKLDIKGNGELEPNPMLIKNEGTNEFRLFSVSDISYANSSVIFNRSRGTIGSEENLITEDRVGGIYWRPYISNDYQRTAAIQAFVGAGVSSTSYPTNIRFETTLVGSSIREEVMRISEEGNVGIGTDAPKSKLQVKSGDIYIEDIGSGVIMKSPNGTCWRMTVDDGGSPVFSSIACPN